RLRSGHDHSNAVPDPTGRVWAVPEGGCVMAAVQTVTAAKTGAPAKVRALLPGGGRLLARLLLLGGGSLNGVPSTWLVWATCKPNTEIYSIPITLWPRNVTYFNYQQLFSEFPFARWYGNSVLVASTRTLLSVFLSALAGFGFAKYRF